jgi:Fe-Mn family superoxide dismutase
MPHDLPPLPYAEDALEPHIAADALRLHRRVHANDVDRLNRALERTHFADLPIAETLTRLDEILDGPITAYRRTKVRAFGGSHLNHSLLWENLRPPGGPTPAGALAEAIERDIGSLDRLVDRMTRAALGITGSGWAWLVHDGAGLAVTVTRDNDSPVMEGQVPLLALDMWEHAHLPHRGLDRRAHVEAFWPLVDWPVVARRSADAASR